MNIEIKSKKKKRTKVPHYLMYVEFMEGDADGHQTNKIKFKEDEREDMERFILAVEGCNHAYQNGRGGYDEYNGMPEYDFFFGEEIGFDDGTYDDVIGDRDVDVDYDEIYEELTAKYNPNSINMDHPSDSSYISTSFRGWSIVFVDENGDKQDVKVKFNDKEKERFAEIKKLFT
jgi:hypothetical protein